MAVPLCPSFQNTSKKYLTSTGKCHRFIPEVPQNFDCRVKALLRQESLNKDIVIKEEQFKTLYCEDYPNKSHHLKDKYGRSYPAYTIDYSRNVQEKAHTFDLPSTSGNKTIFDKKIFKNVLPLRILWMPQKRVPNYGMTSEKQDNYRKQSFSDGYPYLHESCAHFEDSLPPACSWQTQSPPGMYCTEYCHIGRDAVRRIVDPNKPKREIRRTPNCPRICTR